jgi:hypothetical protein
VATTCIVMAVAVLSNRWTAIVGAEHIKARDQPPQPPSSRA